MKRAATLITLLVATAWMVLPGMAQGMSARIKGQVLGADGKPVPKAEVSFVLQGSKDSFKTKTDKNGNYEYFTLPQGTYDIIVTVPDGQPATIQKGVTAKSGMTATVNADFQAMAAGVDAPPPGMTKEQAAEYEKKVKEQEDQNKKLGQLNGLLAQNKQLVDAKQYDQAIAAMEQAVALDQTHAVLYANLADDYTDAKQYDKSADAYSKAVALDPKNAGYVINEGIALANAGKMDDAKAALDKAAAMDPTKAKLAIYNEGVVLWNKGDADSALAAFNQLIQIDPTNADAYYYKGMCLLNKAGMDPKTNKLQVVPGTVEALKKSIDLAPSGPNAANAKAALSTIGGGI